MEPTESTDTPELAEPRVDSQANSLAESQPRPPKAGWQRTATLFLVGQAVTLFGTMITGHAISWYVTLQTQSGIVLMLFSIAMMVPMAISSPLGGVWADRYNRKYLINIVDGAIALTTLIVALFFSAGIEWLGLLFACALVRGFGQGIQMPAVTAILPDIVPAEQLVRVNGFNASIQSLSMFASPMLAAALLTFFPIQALMYLDVVTAAIGIAIVFLFVQTHKGMRRHAAILPADAYQLTENSAVESGSAAVAESASGSAAVAEPATVAATPAAPALAAAAATVPEPALAAAATVAATPAAPAPVGFFPEFKAGLRYMMGHRFILAFVIMSLLFSILCVPASLLTPLQVTRDFGADAWRLGAIEVVFAIGMMLGGVLIGIWGGFKNRIHTMALSTLLFGLGTVGLGLLSNFWVYLACMCMVGITMPFFNAPVMAILQARVAPDFMGRVFSVFTMLGSLAMPLGMLFFGPLADSISIDLLLIVTGFGIALLAAYLVLVRSIREAGLVPEVPPGAAEAEASGAAAEAGGAAAESEAAVQPGAADAGGE